MPWSARVAGRQNAARASGPRSPIPSSSLSKPSSRTRSTSSAAANGAHSSRVSSRTGITCVRSSEHGSTAASRFISRSVLTAVSSPRCRRSSAAAPLPSRGARAAALSGDARQTVRSCSALRSRQPAGSASRRARARRSRRCSPIASCARRATKPRAEASTDSWSAATMPRSATLASAPSRCGLRAHAPQRPRGSRCRAGRSRTT